MLTGDLRSAVRTWSSLDLVASPDPLVEGLLGILYLAVDEPARAYPRLTSAHKALPEAGFLCVSLADAAAHCGDAEMALRLIERAKSLSKIEDGTGGLRRVEADALAAAGKYEEAAAKYETFRPAHNLVGILHYADMLDGLGRPREGLAMLANGIQTVTNWTKVNRAFIERADRWWAGLDDRQRTVLAESRRDDDPCDPQSLSALLFAYRVATLQVQRAGPPLNLTGQPTPPPAKPAPMTPTPSLSEIAATIPVTDLQAWVFINRFPDSALTPRVRANLAGPERTLSAETRGEFEAWMREWKAVNKPGRVRQYFGFAPQ